MTDLVLHIEEGTAKIEENDGAAIRGECKRTLERNLKNLSAKKTRQERVDRRCIKLLKEKKLYVS